MGKKRKQASINQFHEMNGDVQSSPKKKVKLEFDQHSEELMEVTPDLDTSHHEEGSDFGAKDGNDFTDWEISELDILIENVEKQVPKTDSSKFSTTFEKINWEMVKFGSHTAEECKKATSLLIQQVRRHRTLLEVLTETKVIAKNPYRNQRTGRINHPDKPKKPMTPYFRFFTEKRAKYQEVNPDLNPTELSKFMASQYAALSEKKRARYRRQYDAEMDEYREKYEQFRNDHIELFKKINKRAATKTEQKGPQKPKKPFQFYSASRVKKYKDENHKSAIEKIKESWNKLSEAKRMKWIKKALKDQKRYELEMDEFLQKNPLFMPPKIGPTLSKTEQKLKNKVEGRPERPPTSGYILYSRIMMPELTDVPAKEKMVMIAKRWKELSEEERSKYNAKAQKSQAKYVEKFDNFLQNLPEDEKEKVLAEHKLKLPSEKKLQQKKPPVRRNIVLNSAFTYYQTQELMRMQREYPGKMKGELIVSINKKWDEMPQTEKQQYVDLAESIKDYLPIKGNRQKQEKKKRGINANPKLGEFIERSGQKQPPKNGFTLFLKEKSSEFTDLRPTEKMRKVADLWKNNLTEMERQQFSEKAKELNNKFVAMLKRYEVSGQLPDLVAERSKSPLKGILKNGLPTKSPSSNSLKVNSPEKPDHNKFFYKDSSDDSDSD